MKKISLILITGFMFLVISSIGNPVLAGSEKFDEKMQPILTEYLKMVDTLASDKTDGVADAAKKIESLAGNLSAFSCYRGACFSLREYTEEHFRRSKENGSGEGYCIIESRTCGFIKTRWSCGLQCQNLQE